MAYRPGQPCHEVYREVGILHHRQYPDLTTFVRFTDEITGSRVSFTSDLDRLAADLKQVAPADARLIDEFIAGARAMGRAGLFWLMGTPPELMGLLGALQEVWSMRRGVP